MATNVVMPQMGESIAEGTIVRWIKKVGDQVDRDEPLFEISTDKVDAEIPSPAAGVLTEIKVKEGETVPVNSVVAVIGGAARSGGRAAAPDAGEAADGRRERRSPGRWPAAGGARRRAGRGSRTPATDEAAGRRRRLAAPEVVAARAPDRARAQRRHRARFSGTGINGRVTKQDILGYIESGGAGGAGGRRRPRPRRGADAARRARARSTSQARTCRSCR